MGFRIPGSPPQSFTTLKDFGVSVGITRDIDDSMTEYTARGIHRIPVFDVRLGLLGEPSILEKADSICDEYHYSNILMLIPPASGCKDGIKPCDQWSRRSLEPFSSRRAVPGAGGTSIKDQDQDRDRGVPAPKLKFVQVISGPCIRLYHVVMLGRESISKGPRRTVPSTLRVTDPEWEQRSYERTKNPPWYATGVESRGPDSRQAYTRVPDSVLYFEAGVN